MIATVRVPREMFGYELTDAHVELLTQGQQLLNDRMDAGQVVLYVDAQPLFTVPGQPETQGFVSDGMLYGMQRRQACMEMPPDQGRCGY